MKKLLLVILLFVLSAQLFSQQEGISYQAVILGPDKKELRGTDADGNIIPEVTIAIKFSIIDIENVLVYEEVQTTNPDAYGRINLFIGTENPESFRQINWDGTAKNLKVDIDFSGTGTDFIDMSQEKLTYVPYSYHRDVTADGELTVNKATNLKGVLTVQGLVELKDSLRVNGRVTISADDLNGSQENLNAYPLRIEGGKQGVAIQIDGELPGRDQNWITFFNGNGDAQGRIEGSSPELKEKAKLIIKEILDGSSGVSIEGDRFYNFSLDNDMLELRNTYFNNSYTQGLIELNVDYAVLIFQTIVDITLAGGTAGFWEDYGDVVFDVIDLMIDGKRLIAFSLEGNQRNSGVVFESGGADYAEWLEKADYSERLNYGEVVGVKGGIISKTILDADQYLVITSNPIIVGAMPQKGKEANFEKVALMGQVPVLVYGQAKVGDYILPSGKGDGTAIALDPDLIKASDFSKIIGVAWSESDFNSLFNYINTAIGFNANQMGTTINSMQTVINSLQNEIKKLNPDYKPVYFDTEKGFKGVQSQTISISEKPAYALCDCGDVPITDNKIQCLIECWISKPSNGNSVDARSNAVRRIVKRPGSSPGSGFNGNVVLEILKEFKDTNMDPIMEPLTDYLFEELVDLSPQGPFENYPDIKDILEKIRDGGLFSGELTIEFLKEKQQRAQDKIKILQQLAGAN
tara:strand:+ start:2212 stop:4284 length:2073 start_codon:yes stop_codon:yes gene_type:complete